MKWKCWGAVGAAVTIALVSLCLVPEIVLTLAQQLGLGWYGFLARVGPTIEWHPFGWLVAIAAFGATAFGVQRVASSRISDWNWRRSVAAVALAVFACAASIALVGAIHETGWMLTSSQPVARWGLDEHWYRGFSSGHLSKLGLAIHNYEEKAGVLPILGPLNIGGKAPPGWIAQIEPYLRPPDSAEDGRELKSPYEVKNWGCRPDEATGLLESHYAGNIRLLGRSTPTRLRDISDGTSNTLMVGEIESGFQHWRDPRNLRDPALGLRPGSNTFCGPWKLRPVTNFVMADGSVKRLSNKTDLKVLRALATPDGNDGAILEGEWEK